MEARCLVRSGSFHSRSGINLCSPRGSESGHGIPFLCKSPSGRVTSPRPAAVHMDAKERIVLRRARSEADLIGFGHVSLSPAPVREDTADPRRNVFSLQGMVMEEEVETEEMEEEEEEHIGGGIGNGRNIAGCGGGDGGRGGQGGDQSGNRRIREYYLEMLKSDPANPLLLRNYGKFLHEVEGDAKGAEECYGRGILASPGDGDLLSLYGKLVWETYRERDRAGAYFQRAVQASPDDCHILAAYAGFLWYAEEEGEDVSSIGGDVALCAPLVGAF